MKNKIMTFILTIFILAVNGNVYAVPTLPNNTGSLTSTVMGTGSHQWENLYRRESSETGATKAPGFGDTYFSKENGVQYKTIIGAVASVNAAKNVFVVEDKNAHTSTTVVTDSETLATLSPGKIATVKLRLGSSMVESIRVGEGSNTGNAPGVGETYFSKENGVQYKTIIGLVTLVNTAKNVFVVEDQNAHISTTVVTDSETLATLSPGKTVFVKLRAGNSIAESVRVGG